MDPNLQDVVWRGEILKQIFGDVGELVSGILNSGYASLTLLDFSCAVETNILLHGKHLQLRNNMTYHRTYVPH